MGYPLNEKIELEAGSGNMGVAKCNMHSICFCIMYVLVVLVNLGRWKTYRSSSDR
jgi:hypothetical protein